MRTEEALILDRKDLLEIRKDKKFKYIKFDDFKIPFNKVIKVAIILFVDNNGDTKIIKNRFGNIS